MPPQKQPESYYVKKSIEAIEKSLAESRERGRTPEETRFHLHRAYCWGPLRAGTKAYKIWNRILLAKEAELGYEPKKHKKTIEKESSEKQVQMNSVKPMVAEPVVLKATKAVNNSVNPATAVNPAWQEFLTENPRPVSKELASKFLRKHCKTMLVLNEDHDKLRVVLRYAGTDEASFTKWEFTRELSNDDPDEWELAFLEAADAAWKLWTESQKGKY